MLPAICKLETAIENETERKRTHNRELRREKVAEKLREDTRVVQICCFDFFFFYTNNIYIYIYCGCPMGGGVALAQSLAGLILGPALRLGQERERGF